MAWSNSLAFCICVASVAVSVELPLKQTAVGLAVTEETFAPIALVITDVVDEVHPNELVEVTV